MKAYSFLVTIASDNLDTEVVLDNLREHMTETLPNGTLANVKMNGIKVYTEQGFKILRSRVYGINVKEAGDGAKSLLEKQPVGA